MVSLGMLLYLFFSSPSCSISWGSRLSSVDVFARWIALAPILEDSMAICSPSGISCSMRPVNTLVRRSSIDPAVFASVCCNRSLRDHRRTKSSSSALSLCTDAVDTCLANIVAHFWRVPIRRRFKVVCLYRHLRLEEFPRIHHNDINFDSTCLSR